MARIIQTGSTPAKRRHAHLRSCAEVMRLLATRPVFDAEARDMTAFLVFNLRGIYTTIDESAQAWDDRNYWRKSEALREKWRWSQTAADRLQTLVLEDRWSEVPDLLVTIVPKLAGIKVQSVTRDADWWVGALRALKRSTKYE